MEMTIGQNGNNTYITFLDDGNNPSIYMADIVPLENRNKIRRLNLEEKPSYVINRPLGEMYKLISIFSNR